MLKTIVLNGQTICYQLEYKKVKNLNLRVRSDGSVYLSAPPHTSQAYIDKMLHDKANFIITHVSYNHQRPQIEKLGYVTGDVFYITGVPYTLQLQQGEKEVAAISGQTITLTVTDDSTDESRKKAVKKMLNRQYDNILHAACKRIYPDFHYLKIKYPTITTKNMKTMWGVCRPFKNNINLNRALAQAPMECIDFVIYHEFTHYLHQDHSPEYYKALERHCPNWKELAEKLRAYKTY